MSSGVFSMLLDEWYVSRGNHKMTHFFGSPHGPLSSSFLSSVCNGWVGFVVLGAGVVLGAVAVASFFAAGSAVPLEVTASYADGFSVFAPFAVVAAATGSASFAPPSSQKLTFLTVSKKLLPWMRAISSSFSVGCLEPSPPANVPAPHGLPPRTSVKSAKRANDVA